MGNVMQRNDGFSSTGKIATTLAMEAGLDQNVGGEPPPPPLSPPSARPGPGAS